MSHSCVYASQVTRINRRFVVADFFAGRGAISKSFKQTGHAAVALDIALDERDVPWLGKLLRTCELPMQDEYVLVS